jgi:hypothetical protein
MQVFAPGFIPTLLSVPARTCAASDALLCRRLRMAGRNPNGFVWQKEIFRPQQS